MFFRKQFLLSMLGASLILTAQPSLAQVAAGAKVTDAQGAEVGTVTKVDGQFYVVKTDKHEVRLPVASFTPHNGALLFGMSRDQLNAEVDKSLAAASANLKAGASVTGSQGGNVGTIDAIDDQYVTVKLTSGKLVRLPRSSVAPGSNGALIGMTVAELEAAAAQATGEAKAGPE